VALSIKNPDVDVLVREICAITGESLTSAIEVALRERLEALTRERSRTVLDDLRDLADEAAGWTVVDPRNPDELLYDQDGLPRGRGACGAARSSTAR